MLKVNQAFHTVRIVLFIGCSSPVVQCLNKINICSQRLDHWSRTPDKKNYGYSMESLNNFQSLPVSEFELFSH